MKYVKAVIFFALLGLSIVMIARRTPSLDNQLRVVYKEEWLLPRFLKNVNVKYKNDPQEAIAFLQTQDDGSWDLLHYYVADGHVEGVKSIFDYIEQLYKEYKSLALKHTIFKLFNARDNEGRSILHHALLRKNNEMTRLVLSFFKRMFGKDHRSVEAFFLEPDNFGWTPLHVATFNDDFENTKLLLRRANKLMNPKQFNKFINADDNEGDRPYDYARPSGRTLLQEYGAEITELSERRTA